MHTSATEDGKNSERSMELQFVTVVEEEGSSTKALKTLTAESRGDEIFTEFWLICEEKAIFDEEILLI